MSARLDTLSRQADLLNNDGMSAKRVGEQGPTPIISGMSCSSDGDHHGRWEHIPCPVCGADRFRMLFKKRGEPIAECRACGLILIDLRPVQAQVIDTVVARGFNWKPGIRILASVA